jgi:large subunit ribosomal protein L1
MAKKEIEEKVAVESRDIQRGKKYQAAKQLVDLSESVPLDDALELLEKTQVTKFDPTVELHINLSVTGVRGNVVLPAGTHKTKKVLIVDDNNLETESKKIEAGKIEFDVMIVKPEMMPKVAKLAKILGPKGLMPNPKAGTVAEDPKKAAEEISGGKVEYKQDKDGIIHLAVGKLAFGKEKLEQNIKEVLRAMPANKVKSIFINLTMAPSISVSVAKK